ncbi:MAG: hypothetical protein AB7O45_07570 [Alphaproteobacteria bacterium]
MDFRRGPVPSLREIARTIGFYRDLLGFTVIGGQPAFTEKV